jgi:porin
MVRRLFWLFRSLCASAAACGVAMLFQVSAASAQAWWDSIPPGQLEVQAGGIPVPSIATSMPYRGDPAGFRKWLAERGVVYGVEYTNDVLSNVHGGTRTGTIDQGKLHGILTVDFDTLAGWQGLTLFANFFQIHNTGRMRRDYVGGINTIAAIEAVPTTRLSEVWFEQRFAGGQASFKIGQIAADTEFFYSDASWIFLQSDWPTISAVNLPSGGAAYPLSTPGFRFKVDPVKNVTLMFELLNGDPAGPGPGDEQLRNKYGLNFRVQDPPFMIGEVQLRRNTDKDDERLATTLKLGSWGHVGRFNDQRYAVGGFLLADPAGSGIPLQHRGNSGFYAVIDQQLYRPKGGDAQSGISLFTRMSISPSDRNLIDRYIDGGILFAGLIPGRPDDKFGASVIYAKFSDSVRAFDRDQVLFTGMPGTIRDFETNLELTYQAQIVPGWYVQPDLQFVWHPNGDATRNAIVTGVRSIWRY